MSTYIQINRLTCRKSAIRPVIGRLNPCFCKEEIQRDDCLSAHFYFSFTNAVAGYCSFDSNQRAAVVAQPAPLLPNEVRLLPDHRNGS